MDGSEFPSGGWDFGDMSKQFVDYGFGGTTVNPDGTYTMSPAEQTMYDSWQSGGMQPIYDSGGDGSYSVTPNILDTYRYYRSPSPYYYPYYYR
jgi:hypothetical protein